MKEQRIRDTHVIVISNGHEEQDVMDFDDVGYENGKL